MFPRIDDYRLDDQSTESQSKEQKVAEEPAKEQKEEADNLITFDDFKKLDLRVATILEAEKVEGADRLLRLQITIGDEQRQIVAGVAEFYSPEDLVGRQIVVVANLQPATIRGVKSQGMLLAAAAGEGLALLRPDPSVPPGSSVS